MDNAGLRLKAVKKVAAAHSVFRDGSFLTLEAQKQKKPPLAGTDIPRELCKKTNVWYNSLKTSCPSGL